MKPAVSSEMRERLVRERFNRHMVTMLRSNGKTQRVCSCGSESDAVDDIYAPGLSAMCPVYLEEQKEGR